MQQLTPTITPTMIDSMGTPQLTQIHAHIHRLFRASGEKSVLVALHTAVATALLARDLSHTTPLSYTPPLPTGLYLKSPHGQLIYDGKKSTIAQPSPIAIEGTHVLISKEHPVGGLAYGLVTIGPPDTIESEQFDSLFNLHRVTTKEREKWWSKCKSLLLYPITSFEPYAAPRPVEVPAGVQMIMQDVKFIDIESDKNVESSEEEQPMPWKASDAQSHTKLANTPAKQKRWAKIANDALSRCLAEDRGKDVCEASAIRQANSVIKKSSAKKELSLDEISRQIRDAWYTQFTPQSAIEQASDSGWVEEIFADYLIAKQNDGLYRYPMQITSDGVTFGEPIKVEAVYVPSSKEVVQVEEVKSEPDPQEESTDSAKVEVSIVQTAPFTGNAADADKELEPTPSPSTDEDDVKVTTTKVVEIPTSQPVQLVPTPQVRKSILDRCIATIKDIVGWTDEDDTSSPSHLPMVFKSKDGTKSYFLIWPTNSYYDREAEAFRIKSLHDFVDRMDSNPIKSELQFWHLKQTKFGNIIWQDIIEERFLAQIGVFDNTPVGDAFKEFFTKYPDSHPEIAPEGWGASHRFEYRSGDRQDGIYDWLHTDESTVLPLRYAANLLNPSPIALGGKEMDDKRRDALREIGEEVGLDLVAYIEATAKTARELADDKVEHKEMKTEDKIKDIAEDTVGEPAEDVSPDEKKDVEDAKSATKVQDTEKVAAIDMDALVAVFVEQAGLKELSTAFAALTARMDKLETADEKKIEEKAEENVPRFALSWMVSSKDESTILTEDEEEEFKDKKPAKGQRGTSTTKAGQLINGLVSQY